MKLRNKKLLNFLNDDALINEPDSSQLDGELMEFGWQDYCDQIDIFTFVSCLSQYEQYQLLQRLMQIFTALPPTDKDTTMTLLFSCVDLACFYRVTTDDILAQRLLLQIYANYSVEWMQERYGGTQESQLRVSESAEMAAANFELKEA